MYTVFGYIHNYKDASLIVHGVRLGLIEPITRRLSMEDRNEIRSGCIFCFREESGGMKRWTDGKIWSPSKILGHFLLYKEVPRFLSKSALKKNKSSSLYQKTTTLPFKEYYNDSQESESYDPENDEMTLFKKTISITYEEHTYHIVSYFQPIFDRHSIFEYPFFRSLNAGISKHPSLQNDSYVEAILKDKINIEKEYQILPFEQKYLKPNIDRDLLEKIACEVLTCKFKLK